MPFTTLIDPAGLAEHQDDPHWVIFDCRFALGDTEAGRRAYSDGHIPGARYAHLNEDLSSRVTPTTGRHPLPDPGVLAQTLGAWGVDESKQVVVYDASSGSIAGRLWWLLRWLGHRDVALLNGGFPRWEREGFPVTAKAPIVTRTTFHARGDPAPPVTADDVDRARLDRAYLVMDARANERFKGSVEPIDAVAGHIPGAVNSPWEANLDASGNFQGAGQLHERYLATLGGVPPDRAILMCGSGVTACHNLIAMEYAGLGGATLYAGSWSEWITNPDRVVSRG